ncbi:MAG TPA: SDR family oxidoreductase [Clostridiales bacterium]|nr:SDR family oxidoreductase [Clostridiales bacterium]
MKKICVITGGGSGMGYATAKLLGEQGYYIIIVGRTVKKLEAAIEELHDMGIEAEAFSCDISDYNSTKLLAKTARERGEVKIVIHAAGLSPQMGDAHKIMEANALGTINVNDAFYEVMREGGCIIDTSSMSAYMTPQFIMPRHGYKYSRTDRNKFMKKMMNRVNLFPKKVRSGVSYAISKSFVIWFARTDAERFGKKGVRVLSVTPGFFETPMGDLEKEEAATYLKYSAIKRMGRPEEIAALFAAAADERMGYLTGTDILCDGGCIASGCNPLKR